MERSNSEELLKDLDQPRQVRDDLKTIRYAVRRGWGIQGTPGMRDSLVKRLTSVVQKETVSVPFASSEGVQTFENEAVADQNAIAAMRILVDMDAVDQRDYWNQDKNNRLDAGLLTERQAIEPVIRRDVLAHDANKIPDGEPDL